jgi:hypothetical protein
MSHSLAFLHVARFCIRPSSCGGPRRDSATPQNDEMFPNGTCPLIASAMARVDSIHCQIDDRLADWQCLIFQNDFRMNLTSGRIWDCCSRVAVAKGPLICRARGGTVRCWTHLLVGAMLIHLGVSLADPVAVRFPEGSVRGFLVLRTAEGKTLAAGDLFQTVKGDRVASHLVFRFKDGSIDDETTTFSQRGNFRLLSDHHIQKGPAFPHPMDTLIDVSSGQVTVRYSENGEEKVASEHLDLPEDLGNGILLNILKNIQPTAKQTKVSYVAATPKPRLVKLSIEPHAEETFLVADSSNKATRFVVKVELGGIAGAIAPLVGKQPADTNVWIAGGRVPAFVKLEGPLYQGGPSWSIELTSPVWKRAPPFGH